MSGAAVAQRQAHCVDAFLVLIEHLVASTLDDIEPEAAFREERQICFRHFGWRHEWLTHMTELQLHAGIALLDECFDRGAYQQALAVATNVSLKFLPPKAEFLLSNSRKRGSAFCLRFDLITQFDGAFLPYR